MSNGTEAKLPVSNPRDGEPTDAAAASQNGRRDSKRFDPINIKVLQNRLVEFLVNQPDHSLSTMTMSRLLGLQGDQILRAHVLKDPRFESAPYRVLLSKIAREKLEASKNTQKQEPPTQPAAEELGSFQKFLGRRIVQVTQSMMERGWLDEIEHSNEPTELHIVLGETEFKASGPARAVQQQFLLFMSMMLAREEK